MSSLRDQLLAKGLVTAKQARKSAQQQKADAKAKSGQNKRKKLLKAEEQARDTAAREAALNEKLGARAARESERARMERALQIRNLILGNRISDRGPCVFHHRDLDGKKLIRMLLSPGMVDQLRRGDAAIVAMDGQYGLMSGSGAEKLDALAPQLLVFWQRDQKTLSRPDQKPLDRTWEPSLRARRATAEDIERLRGR